MIDTLVTLGVGIVIGWFFLPVPEWAKTAMVKITEKVPFLKGFLKD